MSIDFAAVLNQMVEVRASDVHLSPGFAPAVRVRGKITPLDDYPRLTPQDTREIVYSILNDSQRKQFENNLQLDLAYAIPGVARFRVNAFFQRGAISAAFRHIPHEDRVARVARAAARARRLLPQAARLRSRDRSDRLGQVDLARLDDRPHQRRARRAHPHDRGPDRVPPQAQAVHREPARGRLGRGRLQERAQVGPPRRPRRDPRRRDARPRDDLDRADRG